MIINNTIMILIKAEVYFFKHGEKCVNKIFNKYRPAFRFGQNEVLYSGSIQLIDEEEFFFCGIQKKVNILFINNEYILNLIKENNTFGIYNPSVKVGEGQVLEIIVLDD